MTKKAESYSNGTVQSPSWDGISSVDSQFGAIIDTAWRNRHGPNQWANTTLDFIHDLLITHDTFTREQLEKELTGMCAYNQIIYSVRMVDVINGLCFFSIFCFISTTLLIHERHFP